jgi:pyruvate/2-oxoglutarate dehydrogenase complex dihydrolipoamide acyltransferase (E2) component
MANAVIMPKAGITVESCIIGEWLKKVGDQVKVGDILFTYETDKANFECESTAEGELLEIFFNDGDEVPCLENVCAIGNKGDDTASLRPGAAAAAPVAAAPVAEAAPVVEAPKAEEPAPVIAEEKADETPVKKTRKTAKTKKRLMRSMKSF